MDPITLAIVSALAAGAAAGATKVAEKSIVDGYNALKSLIQRKFGRESEIAKAVDGVEARPDSEGRKLTLQEEVVNSAASQDEEILAAARQLLESIITVEANGDRAVAIGGDVTGSTIVTGDQQTVDTGGGAYIGGSVTTGGGDFVGRDQTTISTGLSGQELQQLFAPLIQTVQEAPQDVRPQAVETARALESEVAKGEKADDNRMAKLIDGLVELVPGAVSAVTAIFVNPILAGLTGPVTKFVLDKIQGR